MKPVIASLIFTVSSLSQTFVGIQGGSSSLDVLPAFGESNPHFSSWNKGIAIAFYTDFSIHDVIMFSPSFEYDRYSFSSWEARDSFLYRPPSMAASGEDSHIYRFNIEGKIVLSIARFFNIQPFTGFSFTHEDLGDMEVVFYGHPNSLPSSWLMQPPNHSKTYIAHTAGISLQSSVAYNFGVSLTARMYANYYDRFHTFIGMGVLLRFE